MNAHWKFAAAALCGVFLGLPAAQADEDWLVPSHFVEFGTSQNDLAVIPGEIQLVAGELYRLVVMNPSSSRHILIAPELKAVTLTAGLRRFPGGVELLSATLAEGIELGPGEMIEWYLLPFKEGRYKLHCEEQAHAAAGMEVTVAVTL